MEEKKTIENQPLIKGCFRSDEAREIVSSLFHSKMQYHSISMLSIRERTGGDTSFHSNRISDLSISLDRIMAFINYAKQNEYELDIECDVIIKIIKK